MRKWWEAHSFNSCESKKKKPKHFEKCAVFVEIYFHNYFTTEFSLFLFWIDLKRKEFTNVDMNLFLVIHPLFFSVSHKHVNIVLNESNEEDQMKVSHKQGTKTFIWKSCVTDHVWCIVHIQNEKKKHKSKRKKKTVTKSGV